jgi:hypothetical protein
MKIHIVKFRSTEISKYFDKVVAHTTASVV